MRKKMKKINIFTLILALSMFLCGCQETREITYQQLMKRTEEWKEPKVAIWYYMGSDDEYNYFYFQDLNIEETYKVLRDEMHLEHNFPLTKNRKKWKVMPWGVMENK